MPEVSDMGLGRRARQLRVDTIVRLRWLAVAGQAGAVAFVYFGLGFPMPIALCFLVIAASAWLNVGLRLRFAVNHRLDDGPAAALLAYDVLQLSALLYLTGGLVNPFALLFLAPVMISAVSLSARLTLYLGIVTVAAATALMFFHLPLPWFADGNLTLPFLYSGGIWTAIVLGTAFVGFYASRVAEEARRLADALAATELVLAREQHLTQLDGLAAAAAHELGTPLNTITLVVKELIRLVPPDGPIHDDIVLLTQEAARCRFILGKIASLGHEDASMLESLTFSDMVEEVVAPQRDSAVAVKIVRIGDGAEPVIARNSGVIYGLGNLIENAIDFARKVVTIEARWTRDSVTAVIRDDGPGFSPEVFSRIGEPYVTTRQDRRAKTEEGSGLGLGLFIAKTLLERSGATVAAANAALPASGAILTVKWPRKVFERPRPQRDLRPVPETATVNVI